jgi:hypothetical protein
MDHYADDELASVEALYENDATARHCARKIIGDL